MKRLYRLHPDKEISKVAKALAACEGVGAEQIPMRRPDVLKIKLAVVDGTECVVDTIMASVGVPIPRLFVYRLDAAPPAETVEACIQFGDLVEGGPEHLTFDLDDGGAMWHVDELLRAFAPTGGRPARDPCPGVTS